ncbi:MAG: RNA methyltransferase [Myxococcota bacterium]
MGIETIDDLGDPRVAVYRNVKDAALRDAQGLFVAESRLCVRRLLELGRHRVKSVFVTRVALDALADVLDPDDLAFPIYLASADLMKRVVGFDMHRGCVAAAERGHVPSLDSLLALEPRLIVGLEGVANPENVGNVFRNATAFGADAVLLSADCADPLYRKAIRVSMGGTLRTPFARIDDWPDALGSLSEAGLTSLAFSTLRDAPDLAELKNAERTDRGFILLFGAEGDGLRSATAAAADQMIRIPMAEGVDSLNIATASGVALHHCFGLLNASAIAK